MTKKDYELIARVLNALTWNYQGLKVEQEVLLQVIKSLSNAFKIENTRFNEQKFIDIVYKK